VIDILPKEDQALVNLFKKIKEQKVKWPFKGKIVSYDSQDILIEGNVYG